MKTPMTVDYSKLLGFDTVSNEIADVDFRTESLSAKLGAKVGTKQLAILDLPPLETARSRQQD